MTFNGTSANPSSWSNTKIVGPVPNNATTGPVVVAVGGQASNEVAFSFSSVGSISGFVTRASDNAPVSGGAVQAAQSVDVWSHHLHESYVRAGCADALSHTINHNVPPELQSESLAT